MQTPLAIGLLSIIPGLGFLQLGQFKRALISFSIVFSSTIIALFFIFTSYDYLCGIFIQISFVVWVSQIYFAVQTANTLNKQIIGATNAIQEVIPSTPPLNSSLHERSIFKIRDTVSQQLNLGEHLTHAIMAQCMPTLGSHLFLGVFAFLQMRTYHIGLLENSSLIMIEHDFNGKPADAKRIPFQNVKATQFKKGLLMDKLILDLGEKKPINLQVSFRLRESTQAIFSALQNPAAG